MPLTVHIPHIQSSKSLQYSWIKGKLHFEMASVMG